MKMEVAERNYSCKNRYNDLCAQLVAKSDVCETLRDADEVLKCLYAIVFEQLIKNGEILFPHIGTLYLEYKEGRIWVGHAKTVDGIKGRNYLYKHDRNKVRFKTLVTFENIINDYTIQELDEEKPPIEYTVAKMFQYSSKRNTDTLIRKKKREERRKEDGES